MNQSRRRSTCRPRSYAKKIALSALTAVALCLAGSGTANADDAAPQSAVANGSCCTAQITDAVETVQDILGVVLDSADVHDWG
ncbi:hypothetical protein [Actinacidiphila sp. bgisy167]|uniref:hypothetical protein n=1 Tax=Actinacidiphila sp. bgisy167 TaxID=3413797 RepID=UPI003D7442A1